MRRAGIVERRAPPVAPKNRATGTAFSPDDIPGGVVWFDMQDATAYTESGGVVTTVTNKFSSVVWAEATNRPAFSATGMNNFPCMDFDGTNDKFMDSEAAVVTAFADQKDYYLAFVLQADDLDALEVFFAVADAAVALNGSKRWGTNVTGAGVWVTAGNNNAGTGIVIDSTGNTSTSVVLLEFYSESAAVSIRVNGGAEAPAGTPAAYGTLTPTRAAIACRPSSALATFFDGRIGEIVGYTGVVSSADKALLRAHLLAKWAVT